jgi:hypothetical protein
MRSKKMSCFMDPTSSTPLLDLPNPGKMLEAPTQAKTMEPPHISHLYRHRCQPKSSKSMHVLTNTKSKIRRRKSQRMKLQQRRSSLEFSKRLIGFVRCKRPSLEGRQ